MKTKIKALLLGNIQRRSKNYLPLTGREKEMIKWYIKFEIVSLILIASWIAPAFATLKHYENYKDLQRQVASYKIREVNAQVETTTKEVAGGDRTPEQEYYRLLKQDTDFRNYIDRMSVANNNPGNLVYAGQPNATKNGRFAKFPDARTGFRALIKQIELDQSRNLSLDAFYNKFAPAHENNTESLISEAEHVLSTTREANIANLDAIALAKYITFREHSYK